MTQYKNTLNHKDNRHSCAKLKTYHFSGEEQNKNTFTLNTNKQYISVNEVNEIINKWFNQNSDYPNRTGDDEMDVYVCPKCGHYLISLEEYSEIKPNFCSNCGKALNWKDVYKFGKIVETQII